MKDQDTSKNINAGMLLGKPKRSFSKKYLKWYILVPAVSLLIGVIGIIVTPLIRQTTINGTYYQTSFDANDQPTSVDSSNYLVINKNRAYVVENGERTEAAYDSKNLNIEYKGKTYSLFQEGDYLSLLDISEQNSEKNSYTEQLLVKEGSPSYNKLQK